MDLFLLGLLKGRKRDRKRERNKKKGKKAMGKGNRVVSTAQII